MGCPTRRQTPLLVLILAIMLAFSGCGGNINQATNSPDAIQHTVFIIKESRSFDSYFGRFPGANGATTGVTSSGQIVPLTAMPDIFLGTTCNHWACTVQDVDSGRMDRFDVAAGTNLDAYVQMGERDLPNYWAYAKRFTLAGPLFLIGAWPELSESSLQRGGAIRWSNGQLEQRSVGNELRRQPFGDRSGNGRSGRHHEAIAMFRF